jgi:iron-sulfur cluster repair protein YtfE (RIC family)
MNADSARKALVAQHDQIRAQVDGCRVLARRMLEGERVEIDLDAALARLRETFASHNASETDLVRSLLHGTPRWGPLLVDRMLEEHVAEHAAFWEMLAGSPADVAARMEDLSEELDAHMAAEERTFLNPLVLHEDTIRHRRQEPT